MKEKIRFLQNLIINVVKDTLIIVLFWILYHTAEIAKTVFYLAKNVILILRKKDWSMIQIAECYYKTHWKGFRSLSLGVTFLMVLLSIGDAFAQTCKVTDFLYLNDPQDNFSTGFVHKLKIGTGGTLSEVANGLGNTPWIPTGAGLGSPHGLGQDLNGNLYIGQHPEGPIAKIKCDGTIDNLNFINDGGFNIVSKDGYLYVNSFGTNRISRYSLCDGSLQGYITLNGSLPELDWGLFISTNGTFYATTGVTSDYSNTSGTKAIYRFTPTNTDFTNHTDYMPLVSANNYPPGAQAANLSMTAAGAWLWGITADDAGNMYVIAEDPWFNHQDTDFTGYTWILKYDPAGNLVASTSAKQTSSPLTGFKGGRGILYYPALNVLYVAAGPNGDCISKINPSDLSYLGAAAGNVPNQNPKTLRIASEACPVLASTVVDTTLCNLKVGDKLFLSQLIGKCNAPICGGTWTASPSNAGMTFNQCDLSFTVTGLTGCGKFTLTNVGGSCGDFTIEANIAFIDIKAPVLSGSQTICSYDNPVAFTVATPASSSGTITYQWQKSTTSCTTGFSDIVGATNSTYDPPLLSQTTYYRVVVSAKGGCTPPPKTCSDTSNCVTVTVNPKPNAGTDQSPVCVGNTAITTATLAATAITGGSWTQVATNPTGAIITTASSANSTITGLKPGIYKFIWTATSCADTVQITIPNCTCAPPTAVTASSNSPVAQGGTINLTSTSTGGTSYAWSGPKGFTSASQNPTIATATNAMAGTYTVTVTSSGTCTATATTLVAITPTTVVCSLLPTPLTMTGSEYGSGFGNAPQSEDFTLNGGTNTTAENNIAGFHITASNEGSFFAFCTEITQPILPLQNSYTHEFNGTTNGFTASQALRLSQLMQAAGFDAITGFGAGGTIAKYVAMQMAVWNVMYDTDYSVSSGTFYSVTDNNGSKAIADGWLAIAQTITSPTVDVHKIHHSTGQDCIIPKPVPPISLTVTQPTCTGTNSPNNGSITIVGFTTGQRYQYSPGSTFNSGSAIPASITAIPSGGVITSTLANTSGSYTVRVYDATDDACFTDRIVTITSVVCCTPPTAVTASSNSPVAQGGTINLTSSSTGGTSYAWSGPNSFASTSQNPSIATATNAMAGTYTVTVTSSGTCTATATTLVAITPTCTPPTAVTANNNSPVIQGGTINLTSTSTGGTSYSWSGPNGFASTLQNPSIANATSGMVGTYTVTVTSSGTCTATATTSVISVTASCTPPTAVTASSNSPVSQGGTINLTSSSTGGTSYSWSGPNGFTSTLQNPNIANASNSMIGTYTVIVTSSGICTATATTAIGALLPPTCTPPTAVTASSNSPVAQGGTINLTSSSTGGTSYAWSGPNSFASTLQNPSIASATNAMAGTYTVTVTSSGTCTATATTLVAITATCTPPTAVTASSNSPVAQGGTINLTSSSTGGTSYAWSGPNSFASTLQNPSIASATNAMAGTYTVTVTSSGTCTATATTLVAITATCTPPTAVTASSNSPVAQGGTINLTSSSTGGTSYVWSGPNSFASTLQNPSIASATSAMAGTYTVTVTSSGTCTATATTLVAITATCTPPTAVTANNNSPVAQGGTINLTSTSTGGTSYAWSGPNGFTSTLQNPSIANATTAMVGTYTVTVMSSGTCTATATTSVISVTATCTPPTAVTASSNSPVTQGGTINLTSTSTGGTSYSWSGPNGFSSTLQNPSIANATSGMVGTYTVTVTSSGTCTATATTAIGALLPPTCTPPTAVTASSNSPVAQGGTINLTSTSTGGTSYAWSGPNGFTSTAQNPSIATATNAMAGTYTVTVTSSGTCTATATTVVLLPKGSLGDFVWKDANNNGIQDETTANAGGVANVIVELYKNGTLFNKDTTDATGHYLFTNLDAGTYKIKIVSTTLPAGCEISSNPNAGTDDAKDSDVDKTTGFSGDYVIDPIDPTKKDILTVDAGLYSPKGSLGDFVWKDANNNGIQDETTANAGGVANVIVELYKNGTLLTKDTTDATGHYLFTNLDAGTYKIKIVSTTLPAGCEISSVPNAGTDDAKDSDVDKTTGFSGDYVIDPIDPTKKDILTVDAGLYSPKGSLGDFVWKDANNNGIQDETTANAGGVANVIVELYKNGTLFNKDTTDATGHYLFTNLDAGTYKIKIVSTTLPAGCEISSNPNAGTDDAKDSDVDKTTGFSGDYVIDPIDPTKKDILTVDAGLYSPKGSLGDFVWKDANNNGIQDETTANAGGVANVIVELYKNGTLLTKDTTDATGHYLFTNLDAGTYKIKIVSTILPAGCEISSVPNAGTDDAKDSDVDKTTGFSGDYVINPTDPTKKDILTVDAGLYSPKGSLGDFVWKDANNNGIQDETTANAGGVANVIVELYKNGTLFNKDTTDATGKYLFTNLDAGTYKIKIVSTTLPAGCEISSNPNAGTDDTKDSDVDKTTGFSGDYVINPIDPTKKDILTVDAGVSNICVQSPQTVFSTCVDNVQLPAPKAGQVWSVVSGNPSNAIINQSGMVTGMTALGIYHFTLSNTNGTCSETFDVTHSDCTKKYDLSLKKKVNNKLPQLNEVINYTIVVKNEGEGTATGVEVSDTLPSGLQYQSFNVVRGTGVYSPSTSVWNLGTLVPGDSAILTISVKVMAQGVMFNKAEISKMNEKDIDSTPGNNNENEDDLGRACISVPITICQGEQIEVSVPTTFQNVQWFKTVGATTVFVQTGNTISISTSGTYTYLASNGNCPAEGCCPVIVIVGDCCKPNVCIPYGITKTKGKK